MEINMSTLNQGYTVIYVGKRFLALTDHLVDQRDLKGLQELNHILVKFIKGGIDGGEVSLIEIGEYISEALAGFEAGKTADAIKSSSIRQLLNTPR
jgi:hypothetical protein